MFRVRNDGASCGSGEKADGCEGGRVESVAKRRGSGHVKIEMKMNDAKERKKERRKRKWSREWGSIKKK